MCGASPPGCEAEILYTFSRHLKVIEVVRQDENGKVEAHFSDTGIVSEALKHLRDGTRCVAFIDPYGDTTFNQLQIPVLVQEIRALTQGLDRDLSSRLHALAEFVASALQQPHTYIKFIGD